MNQLYSKALLLLALVVWAGSTALGQFTASGTVTDVDNEPLVGASVVVKGTTIGAFTNNQGQFSLEVPDAANTVIVSFVGYLSQEVAVSESSSKVTVRLESENTTTEEVVIVGYGTQSRGSVTGAVTQINSEAIQQVPLGSVEQALQGNVAGVQSVMSNGQPGANVNILIRGQGSIGAASDPLFVIDGIPVVSGNLTENAETSNPLATLNPNDIETVSVLKDAAATAIYGSRGANGVILITTKSGRPGKAKIDFRTQIGFNDWAVSENKRLRGLTAEEYTHLYIEGYKNRSGEDIQTTIDRFNGQFPDPETGLPAVDIIPDGSGGYTLGEIRVDTRWLDELSRQGLNQSYDLSISGGDEKITYFASGSYFSQEAPIIYSELERFSSRVNLAIQASSKLKITNNLNVSRTTQQGMNDATRWANPMYNGYLMAPVVPIRDASGQFYDGHKSFFMGGNNPVGSLSGDDVQQWAMTRILDNLTGQYEIIDGLTFKSAWSFDLLNFQENYFRNARYGDGRGTQGYGSEASKNILNWIGTQTLNYGKSFDGSHNLLALVGYEAQKSATREIFTDAETFPHPTLRTLSSAANPTTASSDLFEYSFTSIFGRVNYNFNEKYFVSGSIRRDGSSRFGANTRFGDFWSVGASWRLDNEAFLEGVSFINDLKLRASYGVTGNAGIGNYESIATFDFGADYDGVPGGFPGQIGNNSLTWERAESFNVGLDFGILGNRVNGIVEYFDRESDNLLLDVPISRTTGFPSILQNFGAMKNSGFEVTLNAEIINSGDFSWSVGGNVTFLRNRITKLDEEFIDGSKLRREGIDYQSYYMYDWAGVDPQTGDPTWYIDSTRTETSSSVNDINRFLIDKTATPKHFGGFNTVLNWKGVIVNAQFAYSWDSWLYDATAWVLQGDGRFTPRSQTNKVLDRWQNPGDVTDVPRFAWGNTTSSNLQNSTRYLLDGSHIRLRNLTVSYDLPASVVSKVNMRTTRIYARGINVWTWTRDKDLYIDPEAAFSGVILSPVPNLKTWTVGIDFGF